ncbi:MAG: hypothetical protein JF616_18245 [Fibrobacteres bacterium]|nr:hypothetical protein [Fibrobacterota bacterium]
MSLSIQAIEFDGLEAIEILTSKARMIIVTALGPRIAWFGTRKGRNLLFWDYDRKYKRGAWQLLGGHRVWAMRPLGDESEETYADDNGACSVRVSARAVEVRGAAHPAFKIAKTISVKVLADDTFIIDDRLTNSSEMIWSGGVWGLTCTLPKSNTRYGIPLGREGEWDMFVVGYPKRWGGGQTARVDDSAVRMTEDCMLISGKGRISKRMVQAPQGVIGMTDPGEKISFIKHCEYADGAMYPMGCNVAFYAGKNNFMVEMEFMGGCQSVLPGQTLGMRETWMLRKPVDWARLKGPLPLK